MSATASPPTQTVSLTIDGIPISVPKGTLLVEAAKDFGASDRLRAELAQVGVAVADTPEGQTWSLLA